jgi:cysteine protease ATG4
MRITPRKRLTLTFWLNRELVHEYQGDEFGIYVSNNGMVYKDEVQALCGGSLGGKWTKSLILLIPVRLGVDAVPETYHQIMASLFQYPQSLGIAGGKPRSSLYFVAMQDDALFYLDPHVVFPAAQTTNIPFDTRVSSSNPP